jgi:hypothetical protein
MSNLRTLRNLFLGQEQLSFNQLQKIRGGMDNSNNNPNPTANVPEFVVLPNQALAALDDNKRPERPGGGVSTH